MCFMVQLIGTSCLTKFSLPVMEKKAADEAIGVKKGDLCGISASLLPV